MNQSNGQSESSDLEAAVVAEAQKFAEWVAQTGYETRFPCATHKNHRCGVMHRRTRRSDCQHRLYHQWKELESERKIQ